MLRKLAQRVARMVFPLLFVLSAAAAFASTQLLDANPGGDPAPGGGDPKPGGDPAPGGDPKPQGDPKPADPAPKGDPKPDDEPLGEPGKKALQAERDARAAEKTRADAAEAELKKFQDAQLSDSERRDKRATELETSNNDLTRELQQERVSIAFERVGRKQDALQPEALWKLVDYSEITFDADGRPTNVEALVEKMKTETYPNMFTTGGAKPTVDGGASPSPATGFDASKQLERVQAQTGIK